MNDKDKIDFLYKTVRLLASILVELETGHNGDIEDHNHYVFDEDEKPSDLIVLNPPLETIIEHLNKRWADGKKKWREENLDYLKAVHEEYGKLPKYFEGSNLIYLEGIQSVDEEVKQVLEWIKHVKLEEILA